MHTGLGIQGQEKSSPIFLGKQPLPNEKIISLILTIEHLRGNAPSDGQTKTPNNTT